MFKGNAPPADVVERIAICAYLDWLAKSIEANGALLGECNASALLDAVRDNIAEGRHHDVINVEVVQLAPGGSLQ